MKSIVQVFIVVVAVLTVFVSSYQGSDSSYPLPFSRQLSKGNSGNDVRILQQLIKRCSAVPSGLKMQDKVFDQATVTGLAAYQKHFGLSSSGVMDVTTAKSLLSSELQDGFKPIYCREGVATALPLPYKYLVDIPIFFNRSIETTGTLFDSKCNALHTFRVRTHGQKEYNELTSNGNTPTGLYTFDLNTPEPDPKSYGPYNVNRAVLGLRGNARVIIPEIRNGILLHTGEWDNWNPSLPMPNSHGCMHAHPADIKLISEILTEKLGVKVHENPFGKLPYPFEPQGLLSIWVKSN